MIVSGKRRARKKPPPSPADLRPTWDRFSPLHALLMQFVERHLPHPIRTSVLLETFGTRRAPRIIRELIESRHLSVFLSPSPGHIHFAGVTRRIQGQAELPEWFFKHLIPLAGQPPAAPEDLGAHPAIWRRVCLALDNQLPISQCPYHHTRSPIQGSIPSVK